MSRLRIRVTVGFIVILMLLLLILGIYNGNLLEDTYIDTLSERLQKEAMIIASSFNWTIIKGNQGQLSDLVQSWSTAGEARVTVVDTDGIVLADSDVSSSAMENHRMRQEIEQAFRGETGMAIRQSSSTGIDQLYVAVPLLAGEQIVGVVRLSYPIQLAESKVHRLWIGQAVIFVFAFILFSIIGSQLVRRFTRPIEKITEIARSVSRQEFGTKVDVKGRSELAQLATAINEMSHSLEQQMKQIREDEKRLTDVLTNLVSGVMLINPEGTILLANRMAKQMLGLSSTIHELQHFNEGIHDVTMKQWIQQVVIDQQSLRNELHTYFPVEKIIDTSLAPLFDGDGKFAGVVVVLHDLTDIRRLEKIRSDFVANASHELKTPVTSIKGFTETLLDGDLEEKDTVRSFLDIIHTESERLERLIQEILDLSRIEQKRMALHYVRSNMNQVVEDVAHSLQVQLERKSLRFSNTIPTHIEIDIDVDQVKQIFINLITNAITYTPENGHISTSAFVKEHSVIFLVADTGIGIPDKDKGRIFERFYRVDKARSRNSGGTGLGLSIVKHLVEAHRGKIWVESEEGKGAQFYFELPKNKAMQ